MYNCNMIGIDEVGRGAWAGPLLVVAVRQIAKLPEGLGDSKKLSSIKRLSLIQSIKECCEIGCGWVTSEEIDNLGLTNAMRLAVKRALSEIGAQPNEEIIMDGNINYCQSEFLNVKCVIRADADYPIVSAASIFAKVTRDKSMAKKALEYPHYNFEKNVGYGTLKHRQMLEKFGISKIHRQSFQPIKAFL